MRIAFIQIAAPEPGLPEVGEAEVRAGGGIGFPGAAAFERGALEVGAAKARAAEKAPFEAAPGQNLVLEIVSTQILALEHPPRRLGAVRAVRWSLFRHGAPPTRAVAIVQ